LGCVDGDEEALATALLGVFDDALRDISVLVDLPMTVSALILGS